MARNIFDRIVKAAGSQAGLAKALGVSRQAVSNWKADGIPLERAFDIARLTGIPLEEIRPDKFQKSA